MVYACGVFIVVGDNDGIKRLISLSLKRRSHAAVMYYVAFAT